MVYQGNVSSSTYIILSFSRNIACTYMMISVLDNISDAINKCQFTIFTDLKKIAGVQESILIKGLCIDLWTIVISLSSIY